MSLSPIFIYFNCPEYSSQNFSFKKTASPSAISLFNQRLQAAQQKMCAPFMYTQNSKNLILAEYEFDVSEINKDASEAPAYAFNSDILTVEISCRGPKCEDHHGLNEIMSHLWSYVKKRSRIPSSLKTDLKFILHKKQICTTITKSRQLIHGLVMHFVFQKTDVNDWTKNGFCMPVVKMSISLTCSWERQTMDTNSKFIT
jgi:hypothetical protein